MDFSKIKKILYILMIVSLILSIKSKVFAYSSSSLTTVTLNENSYDLDLSYITNNFNYYILCWNKSRSGSYYRTYISLFCCDEEVTFTASSSSLNVSYLNPNNSPHSDIYHFRVEVTSSSNSSYSFNDAVYYWNNTQFNPSLGSYSFNNDSNLTIAQSVSGNIGISNSGKYHITYSNFNVKDSNNDIIFNNNAITNPFFDNVSEILNGYPDGVFISVGDFSKNDNLYFHLLKIDNTVSTSDGSVYYYSDKTFILNKDSKYYSTYYGVEDSDAFYYYVPRYNLSLDTNSSYLYVLNNSSEQIQNSHGLYEIDYSIGIYDVISSDTTGVITATEEQSDKLKNIEESMTNSNNQINEINNTINNTNISQDTETNIDTNLNFNNQNNDLNNMNNGFFTRLATMLSNLLGYNLSDDTVVRIPYPNSQKYLELHSNILYNNVTGGLRVIINAFWIYIFAFYMYKFINKLYIAISTGNILDTFSSSGEAITNNML